MRLDYPVIVSKEKNDYIAYVPDLDIDTFGRYKNDIVTHVTIDPLLYRQNNDNISVRRNVTIPSWLDKIVRQNKINVSEFLQNMLRRELRV